MMRHSLLLLLSALILPGCSRDPGLFSEQNARAHVEMIAGTIGSRPPGTEAHARARAYVIDQLKLYGYEVRVQETDARRAELGRTARVANIIGILPGARPQALGLLSHYDSRADTPGAGDDAFGVAVSLEAARLIAASSSRQWTTMVLVTDGEEQGLMGAAALMNDAQVRDNLAAYINIESTGSAGPSLLFETGPGNAWLVRPWARVAPNPRGGSFALEIYKRLPNDTDFSILKRHQVPGLNFAIVGDSYTYHTSRDTPERLSSRALRDTGQNVVAIAAALQDVDITARTDGDATYLDIGGTAAVSWTPAVSFTMSAAAILLGFLAWLRVTRFLIREEGLARWCLGLLWMALALAATFAAMLGAAWALRTARETYHPWYAHPDRFFLLLLAAGGTVGWMMARLGRVIPQRAKGLRHAAVVWTYTLPAWIVLALATVWFGPAAAYLWTLPLLAAAIALLLLPVARDAAVRIASIVVLAVSATLWLPNTLDLLHFMVALFARLPVITPLVVYPALIALATLMVAPPLFAVLAPPRALLRPSIATGVALAALALTWVAAWLAPAYTEARPLRRAVHAFQEPGSAPSLWQVGSHEPGLDLEEGAPGGWTMADPPATSIPWGRFPEPFVFTTAAEPLGPAPASIGAFEAVPASDGGTGTTLQISILPKQPSLAISFVLPTGIVPARTNLPGALRAGRWTATYLTPPADGIAWQARFTSATPEQLRATRIAVTSTRIPGGSGWQHLPAWLPQQRVVWTARATWVLDPAAPPPLEPLPPLR